MSPDPLRTRITSNYESTDTDSRMAEGQGWYMDGAGDSGGGVWTEGQVNPWNPLIINPYNTNICV